MQPQVPQPPGLTSLNSFRFGSDPLRYLQGIQGWFEDVAAIPLPNRPPVVIVTNPGLIHDALSRPQEFRRLPAQEPSSVIAENSVIQTEGDLWQQQRRIMRPAFSSRRAQAYANTVGGRVAELAAEWRDEGTQGERRNLHREMTTLTIRVATEILLDEDIGRDRAEQFYEWSQGTGEAFEISLSTFGPDWIPGQLSRGVQEAADGIHGLSEELIERRRTTLANNEDQDPPADLIGLLIQAESNPSVEFEENQIRDEVSAFLIAGHETTALSLTYTLSLLSWNPEVQAQVRAEAQRVFGDESVVPCYEHLPELETTRRVYDEALRLYPPAWATFREASGEIRLGSYRIEQGSIIIMPQWSVHRDKRYFERPEKFDPSRWETQSPTSVEAYFPFASGQHACVGRQFAVSGATLALARLVQEFDIEIPATALDDLQPAPTLRPRDGVPAVIGPAE